MEFDLCHKYSESLKLDSDPSPELEFNDTEFDVVDCGVEVKTEKCDSSVIEIIDVADIFKEEDTTSDNYPEWNLKLDMDNHDEHQCAIDGCEHRQNNTCISEPAFEELDSAFYELTTKRGELDSLLDMSKYYELEDYMKSESNCKAENFMKSIIMVDVAESIENEFLNMLSTDPCQDNMVSRTCHDLRGDLTQFENKIPSRANPILDTYITAEQESGSFTPSQYRKVALEDDFDFSFHSQAVERNHYSTNQSLRSRRNAKILENLETEAVMHEWGLNEKAFQYSPRTRSSGFGSPVYLPAEEPLKLPSIEDGLGPIIWTRMVVYCGQ
ncbi:hypothetical protein CDL12_14163 [Handroanthus impetiginosus]|uniref:Uncharacterized protein n=1 Tax=Handroanthus impetiginosus TaxID=429701 RepID=A0A2G9H6S8_9LAMI|nr:hypothetical protein CDL12_14163 [Handroanthus impetiginosus]